MAVKSKEKVRVKGGDPRHLIRWQNLICQYVFCRCCKNKILREEARIGRILQLWLLFCTPVIGLYNGKTMHMLVNVAIVSYNCDD